MIKNLTLINNGIPSLQITKDTGTSTMPLTSGFEIHSANEFLRSLNPRYPVFFRSWIQYKELVDFISHDLKTA